jgi:RimJ/RimL family protein N-acetyltransferase
VTAVLNEPAWPLATTARLHLRRLRPQDLPAFQAYRGDAEVGRWQGWQPMDDAQALTFLEAMAASPWCQPGAWFQLAVADRASDTLLGDIGIHLALGGRVAEIGFTLARGAQGRGLAQEALTAAIACIFEHTPARRVLAITDIRNTACLRLLPRLGLRPFATLDAVFRNLPCQERHFVRYRDTVAPAQLRPAAMADAAAVAGVLATSRRVLMPFVPAVHADEEIRQWVTEVLIPSGGVTVACVGGTVAAVLAVSQAHGLSWIDQLYVHPEHVARGLGTQLLHHALDTLGRPLQLHTFQANRHARGFYERHGFQAAGFTDGEGNEERCPDVLYRLDPCPDADPRRPA